MKMHKILLSCLIATASLANAQYPSDFSLKQFEKEVKSSMVCNYECGTFLGVTVKELNIEKNIIKFNIPLSAEKVSYINLPFKSDSFNWESFSLNGKETNAIMDNNEFLSVVSPKGNHNLEIVAKIKQNKVALLKDPKFFDVNSNIPVRLTKNEGNYFLEIKQENNIKKEEDTNISNNIMGKPLYVIKREFFITEKWKMITTISPLMSESEKVVNIEIPLFEGENVLSNNIKVSDGKVKLNLTNNVFSWESTIEPKDKIIFKNTDSQNLEMWAIYTNNNWIYSYEGENPIESSSNQEYKSINVWKMWPNESVNFKFSLPKFVEGQLSNVTDFNLSSKIDEEMLTYKANFNINTSLGGKYKIIFEDKDIELESLSINNNKIKNEIKDGNLFIDLYAGVNKVSLELKSEKVGFIYSIPKIKFESSVANATFEIYPNDRWVIAVGGGDIKPIVFLLGILISFFLIAIILSKISSAPISKASWVLLLLGVSQNSIFAGIMIISWILLFDNKEKIVNFIKNKQEIETYFNKLQTLMATLTILSLTIIIFSLSKGLLFNPNVFIDGYQSSVGKLFWFVQYWDGENKNPILISTSLTLYRFFMLIWAVWLAFFLMNLLKWMWLEYSKGGYWMKKKLSD